MGFFDNEILVAVMDLILSYPVEDTAFIGLFIMNVEYQKFSHYFRKQVYYYGKGIMNCRFRCGSID